MIINKVIRILILCDIALVGGLGFVSPIFAVFLTRQIEGGNLEVVGYAAAIYWIVESLVVIPFGRYLDKNHGEKDDLLFIAIGSALAALSILGYIFARFPWQIYLLQAFTAVGLGMNVPGYTAIFTRHIDKGKEAFNWSVRSAVVSAGAGVAGALGGIIATRFGFNALFIGVAAFVFLGSLLPWLIRKEIMPKTERGINIFIGKDATPKEQ
ncbi:MFS transporter [Patescibacteria group bacterium]|nr:MFS transporter [Patescibacteria group bacterium]